MVTTGEDVSRFVVDLRDDMDPAVTFRSLVIGTIFAGLGAAVQQVRILGRIHQYVALPLILSYRSMNTNQYQLPYPRSSSSCLYIRLVLPGPKLCLRGLLREEPGLRGSPPRWISSTLASSGSRR